MFRGLYTQQFAVVDLKQAKAWYTALFGKGPYFDEPYYVGFNVEGYEFGLMPAGKGALEASSGGVYWGVDDVEQELKRLLNAGATIHAAIQDVGDGIRKASVKDPFGNVFGIIQNPHFGGSH